MPSLEGGALLGPYKILGPIGAGGMGEVYKAEDTRLNRTVAVKISKASFSERFEREAKIISSLNHPNICSLHDIGHQNGVHYLVMEYIEGTALKGPLPPEKVLHYGMQAAAALDAAHRKGVIHRDLKPGNILVNANGVKLLDFGLAKIGHAAIAPDDATLTQPLTQEGSIMGTYQYMAPEQLEGKEADARTDIWAFGCVLYEIATGKRAFEGATQASLIGNILRGPTPQVATIDPASPPALDRIIRRCLAKDPDDRWQSARDILLELRELISSPPASGIPAAPITTTPPVPSRGRAVIGQAASAVLAVIALIAGFVAWSGGQVPAPQRQEFSINPPPEHRFQPLVGEEGGLAISPDGRTLAFLAVGKAGQSTLWVRSLENGSLRLLPGTERARHLFWSPDSRSLGFFAEGKLKRMSVEGGAAEILGDAPGDRGGTWNQNGVILFGTIAQGIRRMSASGGPSVALTNVGSNTGDMTHLWPQFLPDGDRFIYTNYAASATAGIYLSSLSAPGERKRLVNFSSSAIFAPATGNAASHLLYMRDGVLLAQKFDLSKNELVGEPRQVAQRVAFSPGTVGVDATVSNTGILVYSAAGGARQQLYWRNRDGARTATLGEVGAVSFPSLSRDNRWLAYRKIDASNNYDVWITHLERSFSSRFTFDATIESFPAWSPDATWLAYGQNRNGIFGVCRKRASGMGEVESIASGAYPGDWSPDGRYLLLSNDASTGGSDILITEATPGAKISLYLAGPFSEGFPRFSPDGKWIAYVSDYGGVREIYVQKFSPPGQPAVAGRWQISTTGGTEPRWRGDSQEIFFLSLDGKMMAVPVRVSDAGVQVGAAKALFETPAESGSNIIWDYDVTRDGQRFIIAEPVNVGEVQPYTVILNWATGLK